MDKFLMSNTTEAKLVRTMVQGYSVYSNAESSRLSWATKANASDGSIGYSNTNVSFICINVNIRR